MFPPRNPFTLDSLGLLPLSPFGPSWLSAPLWRAGLSEKKQFDVLFPTFSQGFSGTVPPSLFPLSFFFNFLRVPADATGTARNRKPRPHGCAQFFPPFSFPASQSRQHECALLFSDAPADLLERVNTHPSIYPSFLSSALERLWSVAAFFVFPASRSKHPYHTWHGQPVKFPTRVGFGPSTPPFIRRCPLFSFSTVFPGERWLRLAPQGRFPRPFER